MRVTALHHTPTVQSQMDQDSTGVNTDIFKTHSVRSTATLAAANVGITTSDILKATDWSSESVFHLKGSFGPRIISTTVNNSVLLMQYRVVHKH